MPDETDVPLDPAMIKVLASDTRLDILKQLKQRRMTLTELANALGLKKATILEHLERLTTAGLVRRMDDGERLWVYYELTRRGGYVVTPGRTRFYLLVGGSALAAVVALALALVFLVGQAPSPGGPGPLGQLDQKGGLNVAERSLVTGDVMHVLVGPEFVGATHSYLLLPQEADALRNGVTGILGLPLEEHAQGPVLELRPTGPVPSGTYYVYVRDDYGHDNRASMPPVSVQAAEAQVLPAIWWRGLDSDARAQVQLRGSGVNGTVLLVPVADPAADAILAVPLRGGAATLGASALDDAAPGTYQLLLLRPDNVSAPLAAQLEVREPGIAIAPLSVLAGQATQLSVTAAAPGSDAQVSVRAGGSVIGQVRGADSVQLGPRDAGSVDIEVGRAVHASVRVLPDLRPSLDARSDGQLVLALNASGRGPASGVQVLLDGQALGATEANGTLLLGSLANGTHALALRAPGQPEVARGLLVRGGTVLDAPRPVDVVVDPPTDVGPGGFTLATELHSRAAAPMRVTLAAYVDGALAASQAIDLAPGGAGNATLRVLAEGGHHQVEARVLLPPQPALGGSASASAAGAEPPATGGTAGGSGASSGASGTGGGSSGGPASLPAGSADGMAYDAYDAAQLQVDVPLPAMAAEAFRGYSPEPVFPNRDLQDELAQRGTAAKTPGFELALLGLAVLVAVTARRRR
ncbi:MAG: winged helix-turn-helix domain-containing protein [Halobacteriales archaeon]|nr:winged helix-turn-helix domain-containing protein [Halobacteriales archaeon]